MRYISITDLYNPQVRLPSYSPFLFGCVTFNCAAGTAYASLIGLVHYVNKCFLFIHTFLTSREILHIIHLYPKITLYMHMTLKLC